MKAYNKKILNPPMPQQCAPSERPHQLAHRAARGARRAALPRRARAARPQQGDTRHAAQLRHVTAQLPHKIKRAAA